MAATGQQQPVSFVSSVWEGIKGYFKGLVSGGLIGAAGGAALLGGIAVVAGLVATAPFSWPAVGAAAAIGAIYGGLAISTIGSWAGVFTGVVKSRESAQPSSGQLVNALNMAHQHGEMIGVQKGKKWGRYVTERAPVAHAGPGHP